MNTRKDYNRAAKLISNRRRIRKINGIRFDIEDIIENTFVEFFMTDNPKFDEAKFRKACNEIPTKLVTKLPNEIQAGDKLVLKGKTYTTYNVMWDDKKKKYGIVYGLGNILLCSKTDNLTIQVPQ